MLHHKAEGLLARNIVRYRCLRVHESKAGDSGVVVKHTGEGLASANQDLVIGLVVHSVIGGEGVWKESGLSNVAVTFEWFVESRAMRRKNTVVFAWSVTVPAIASDGDCTGSERVLAVIAWRKSGSVLDDAGNSYGVGQTLWAIARCSSRGHWVIIGAMDS